MDKITELQTECEQLKSLEEDFKMSEKKLISDMKKKGDLARQMLSEKDSYIQRLLSNNDSGSGNGNSNSNSSYSSQATGSGKGSSSSGNSSSSSSSSGGVGGGVICGETENLNNMDTNTASITSIHGSPSNSVTGKRSYDSNSAQPLTAQSNPSPSTPSSKSSSNPPMSTAPDSQHQPQSQSQGREGGSEGRVGAANCRSVTLSQTNQDQQAYLKQAFCGFLKAKEAVEMEHLGAINYFLLLNFITFTFTPSLALFLVLFRISLSLVLLCFALIGPSKAALFSQRIF